MKSRYKVTAVVLLLACSGLAWAGNPEPQGPPSSTFSLNLEAIYARLMSGAAGTPTAFTEPTTAPGTGTMMTLDQIMAAAPAEDNTSGAQPGEVLAGKSFWSLRTDGAGSSTWGLSVGTLPTRTVDPTTVLQLAGNYAAFNLSVVDPDLVSGNVRATATIFGVTGNAYVANTSSGNALPGEILTGRVAWVDGAQITGTMPNNGAVTIAPGTAAQTIPAGYHNGSGTVAGDGNLLAGNIRSGVDIFGVTGTLIPAPPSIQMYGSGFQPDGNFLAYTSLGSTAREIADEACSLSANRPPMTNVRAFISISATDEIRDMPANYGVPTDLPILGPTGVIAVNWADLLDGTIASTLADAGVLVAQYWGTYWSGSSTTGGAVGDTCSDWSSASATNQGNVGDEESVDLYWITSIVGSCNGPHYIVCIAW